jgi:hypothetical protein
VGDKFSIFVITVTIFALMFGCESSMQKEEFIGVEEHHGTRINVICENKKGEFTEKTIHKSQVAVCGNAAIKAEDYLSGKKKYGPLPGCEEKYKNYLSKKKKIN